MGGFVIAAIWHSFRTVCVRIVLSSWVIFSGWKLVCPMGRMEVRGEVSLSAMRRNGSRDIHSQSQSLILCFGSEITTTRTNSIFRSWYWGSPTFWMENVSEGRDGVRVFSLWYEDRQSKFMEICPSIYIHDYRTIELVFLLKNNYNCSSMI